MRRTPLVASGLIAAWCTAAFTAAAAPGAPEASRQKPVGGRIQEPRGPETRDQRPETASAAVEFFEKEVRPVLANACYSCHGEKIQQAGLRADSRAALLKGGDRGPSLTPGEPEKSLLMRAVRHQGLQMPPGRRLPDRQVAALEKWVRMGAPWPGAEKTTAAAGPQTWEDALRVRKEWWSLRPVRQPPLPKVKNAAWSAHPVDRFILAELEAKGLKPAPRADDRTLIRRVYLTLTGLPPTSEEVEAFVRECEAERRGHAGGDARAPRAYERLVDRVLASPHYGERWARHWMDVVRFNETHGYEWNTEIREAWRYRDYLIRAFNQDLPYDRLIREHIAGDLLPNPRRNVKEGFNESEIGTAFYRFGEVGHDVFKEIGLDHLDNQIDTLSKAFQATTVSCARCHDHKLDAVSLKDYYSLLGILASSRQVVHTLDEATANAAPKQRLRSLKAPIRAELARIWQEQLVETRRYLLAAQAERDKAPDAAELAEGLDTERLKAWTTALEKKGQGLEDPLTPWQSAVETVRKGEDLAAAWKQLGARYEAEAKQRAEFNAKHFTLWGDFRNGVPQGWRGDGLALHDGPSPAGEFALSNEGEQVMTGVFPAGFYSHALSETLNASFQSPYLPPDRKFLSIEVMGGQNGAARLVPDFRLLEDGSTLKQPVLGWKRMSKNARDERAYVELATKQDNIRYPDFGGADKGEPFKDPRSFFGVTRAYLHDCDESPKDELTRIRRLFAAEDAVGSLDAVGQRYAAVFQQAISAWAQVKASDDDARWLDWIVRTGLVANKIGASPRLAELVRAYRAAEKEIRPARVVVGMADLDSFDHPIYVRGDHRSPREPAPRGYLEVLCSPGETEPYTGSGRLELADEIADPANPLTARVMVNRVWHYLFGTGLVRTPDDFGRMGETPSHPELLDFLAGAFTSTPNAQRSTPGFGWSLKGLVRSLLLTETFRMSGQASARGREADPENRLLHHFPARRLEAEVIRDSILAVSGRLDRTLYGESIQPYRVEPMPERRLFPGPLDGNGRRSIYTKITLMQGPAFLEVFNFPDPKTAMGRRDVTNVPAQALTMLNDPFVIRQAGVWAVRLTAQPDASVAARIDRMFRRALARPAAPAEVARFETAVRDLAALHQAPAGEVLKSRPVWKDVAHAVYNLKEFIYVR
jgi:hypothetical protein